MMSWQLKQTDTQLFKFDMLVSQYYQNTHNNIMKKLFFTMLACLSLSACASSHYGAAKIISHPAGAEVINIDDDSVLGVTPTVVWWKDNTSERQHIVLRFRKDGHFEKVAPFWLSMRHKSAEQAKSNPQLFETTLQSKERR